MNYLSKIKYTIFIFFISCQVYQDSYHLTQQDAEKRASLLSNIHYNLNIKLGKEDSFEGKVEIQFDVWKSADLRLDYFSGKIDSIILNDENVFDKLSHNNGHLILPDEFIKKGKNLISINFKTPYSRTGNGLHKFIDPDDKEIYLYSQFEAFHANKMFPCFDQPDLKATYQLTTEAPKSWKIISSTLQSSILPSPTNIENNIHTFPISEKFSPYVFSLHAGPFHVWEDKYNNIPLKLYVRRSLSSYVNFADWFQYTKEGFSFFEGYFAYPYPFSKYDQIIVPEFNFGAMENVGAVTFSERFVSRSLMTRAQKENLSDVILHEMAHMWFGNLVTMKWWNGLWLNESFATYMASLAQERGSQFSETWESFFEKMKQWAYSEDSFQTNHAIETKVANTEEAFTQFDGITYGKGASVLKQLVFFIGDDTFQKGVQNYLKRYAFSNSTLKDFLVELELAGGISLRKWSKDWLESKGTNEIEFFSECSDGFLKWKIIQSANGEGNRYRDHKMNIGLYKINSPEKESASTLPKFNYETFSLIYAGRITHFVEKVPFCPDFVLVNADDQDFVTWKWTDVKIDKLKYILQNDTDSFRKLILWSNFADQMELGKVSFDEFYNVAKDILPKEENTKIKKWILSQITADKGYSYFVSRFWLSDDKKIKDLESLSNFLWESLLSEKASTDAQRYWFTAYVDSSYVIKDQERLMEVLNGKISIPGLKIDQDLRWVMLGKLSSLGFSNNEFETLIQKEKINDPSSRGINAAYSIEASSPKDSAKSKWFHIILEPKKSEYSTSTLRIVSYILFPIYQKHLQLPYVKPYLEKLANFNSTEDENYLDGIAKSLTPDFCTDETRLILTKFVNSHSKLPASIKKTLKKQIDLESRCVVMRKKTIEYNAK